MDNTRLYIHPKELYMVMTIALVYIYTIYVCDMRLLSLIFNHPNEETSFYSTFLSLSSYESLLIPVRIMLFNQTRFLLGL